MNSVFLLRFRLFCYSATFFQLGWFLLSPNAIVPYYSHALWLLPSLWLFWWSRAGHYKPVFFVLALIIFNNTIAMSYLVSSEWFVAIIGVALWCAAFYYGFKHLKAIKEAISQSYNP